MLGKTYRVPLISESTRWSNVTERSKRCRVEHPVGQPGVPNSIGHVTGAGALDVKQLEIQLKERKQQLKVQEKLQGEMKKLQRRAKGRSAH